MAPRKRNQPDLEDNESDTGDDRSFTSNANSKRARFDESFYSDGSNDYDELEESALEAATQQLEARKNQTVANEAAEGGIVLSVICENFMCHHFLEIKLGPFMNFIIGHNGSGKSAVLTALTLCLGGKATATNRGSSMKSFIKEGEDTSRITVKLKNGGEGYRQDQYGDEIVIERNFSREGSSNYKLRSKNGRVVSAKREELDNITDFYGLQVDNPMTILTQDAARQFLSNSSNADKYKFFNKGVQLEQLDQDYSLVRTAIGNAEAMAASKQEAIAELQQQLTIAEQKVKQMQSQDNLRNQIDLLGKQMTWAQVNECQNEVEKSQRLVESMRDKISRVEEERDRTSAEFDEAHQELEAANQKIKIEKEKLAPFEDEKTALKEKFDKNRVDLMGIQADERRIQGEIIKATKKIAELHGKIQSEEGRLAERNGGSNTLWAEEKQAAEDEVARLRAVQRDLEQQHIIDKEKLQGAKTRNTQLKGRENQKRQELLEIRGLLTSLREAERDLMSTFGPQMHQLLRAIEQERGFNRKPVGPIGKYVTILKPQWASILDKFFGQTLNAFVVTNRADGQLLLRLMKQTGVNMPYYVTPPQQFDIQEPNEAFDTIYRILEIEDEQVRSQLIIQHGLEQCILIEDLEEANKVMANRRENDYIMQCYAMNHSRKNWGFKVGGSRGAMGVAPVKPSNRAPRMKRSGPSQSEAAQNDIRRIEQELQQLQTETQQAKKEVSDYERTIGDTYGRRLRDLNIKIARQEDLAEGLQAKIDEISADGQLAALQQQLKSAQDGKEFQEGQRGDLLANKKLLDSEQADLSNSIRSVHQDLDMAEDQVKGLERDKDTIERRRQQALAGKNHWYDKLAHYQGLLFEKESELEQNKKKHQEFREVALGICEPIAVPADESSRALDTKLARMWMELEAAEKALGGSKEEIVASFVKAATAYNAAKQQFESFQELLNAAASVLAERRGRWLHFQRFISARARAQFQYLMSERAFKGRLRLEHAMRPPELVIEVQPGGEASGNRAPKTLSGGEKSFSTICLLLSLWEAMGSPLRCLDEFDVFMDPVNRSISVEMMIGSAEKSVGKQFIMITPQNMHQAASTQCRITRMPDPERNSGSQRRLTGN